MTTPHARHLAEMRATMPPRAVDVIPAVVGHLRDLVPCASDGHHECSSCTRKIGGGS